MWLLKTRDEAGCVTLGKSLSFGFKIGPFLRNHMVALTLQTLCVALFAIKGGW